MTRRFKERGVALVMAMVMLLVLSLISVSAIRATNGGIRIVGNMQAQDEAEAAAQVGVEQSMSSLNNFTTPAGSTVAVDINQDGTADYSVTVSAPSCVSSWDVKNSYSAQLVGQTPKTSVYDVQAVVTDNRTGAQVTIHQGVRIDLLPYQSC